MTAVLSDRRPPLPAAPTRPAATGGRPPENRSSLRQVITGLIALPLTLLPFVAYAQFTPEGRLVRDRALVAISPPTLPTLTARQKAAALAAAPRYDGAVMALAYHGIGSASDGEGGFVVSPKRFGEHLATLKAAGMNTVTAAEVAAAFTGGKPLPPNAVMLSFDDGRSDAMMFADPLLEQAGMAATMFVITGAASKPGVYYASWDRIEGYARSGRWDIQSHTAASHREQEAAGGQSLPSLTSLAGGESLEDFRARIRDDLRQARTAIEAHVGRPPVAFAYPFGAYGADRNNDPAIADVVREEVAREYSVAFHQDEQDTVPLLGPTLDLLRLRRLEVQNWSGVELLRRIEGARRTAAGEAAPPPAVPTIDTGAVTVASNGAPAGPPEAASLTAGSAASPTAGTGGAASGPAVGAGGGASSAATLPPAAMPPTNLPPATTPPRGTAPPPTSPPGAFPPPTLPPNTFPPPTSPPTTRPPTTQPPPTVPPGTAPPTTTCTPVGNSGRCPPGKG